MKEQIHQLISTGANSLLRFAKKIIPEKTFRKLQPAYHYTLALLSAFLYRFPSRKIKVIAITGTKGKSTVAELVSAILEEAGYKTALQTTVRFKIGDAEVRNLYKMTMPGRFFIQRFLRKSVNSKADYAILEITSEGAKQFRHVFLELDALIFTNLSPEHIEAHGSFEAYRDAKVSIARKLETSRKNGKVLVVNGDDPESEHFLKIGNVAKYIYCLKEAEPFTERSDGMNFTFGGETVRSKLLGKFNLSNMLAAATYARTERISDVVIKTALEKFGGVPGRLEEIRIAKDQPFKVYVDYAHTPNSLTAVYETFAKAGESKFLIGVLGNTGGGRDTWKRPVMGGIAGKYCNYVILTNEDPYDEDPAEILAQIKRGITAEVPVEIIMDRRSAIRRAIEIAKEITDRSPLTLGTERPKVTILITGKGTDPFIMAAHGTKIPWDDRSIAGEELRSILQLQ